MAAGCTGCGAVFAGGGAAIFGGACTAGLSLAGAAALVGRCTGDRTMAGTAILLRRCISASCTGAGEDDRIPPPPCLCAAVAGCVSTNVNAIAEAVAARVDLRIRRLLMCMEFPYGGLPAQLGVVAADKFRLLNT